jgi:hypothetical protein
LLLKQKSATKTYLINKMPPTKHGVEIWQNHFITIKLTLKDKQQSNKSVLTRHALRGRIFNTS